MENQPESLGSGVGKVVETQMEGELEICQHWGGRLTEL